MKKTVVSSPIYLSGISLARVDKFPANHCKPVLGFTERTTAASDGLRIIEEKKLLLGYSEEVSLYRSGATPVQELKSLKTKNCETCYNEAPVRAFPGHKEGIDALCSGKVLYYMSDLEILKAQIKARSGCNAKIDSYTLSRELYGVYFRRDRSSKPREGGDIDDGRLYAEFNRMLLLLVQREDILQRAFDEEFAGFRVSPDLADFFRSMKLSRGAN